mgnify:CR=1 FL=1
MHRGHDTAGASSYQTHSAAPPPAEAVSYGKSFGGSKGGKAKGAKGGKGKGWNQKSKILNRMLNESFHVQNH